MLSSFVGRNMCLDGKAQLGDVPGLVVLSRFIVG